MTLELPTLGTWSLAHVSGPPTQGLTPVVLSNVSPDMPPEKVRHELIACNGDSLGLHGEDLHLHITKVERMLKRQMEFEELTHTRSFKLWVPHLLGDRMLQKGLSTWLMK